MEGNASQFEVQYNPKEISIDKSVSWQKHKGGSDDAPTLEFSSADPKTLEVTLLFDTFASKEDVRDKYISRLEDLAKVVDELRRPPMIEFIWGSAFPVFKGVIEDLNVRYTMFLPDGTPCRATVTIHMKQAAKAMDANEPGGHCHDKLLDGDEEGVDCGGSCLLRCSAQGQ